MKLTELITGNDNLTLEPAYFLWVFTWAIGMGLEIYAVITGKPFDFQAYGIGMGTMLALGGVGKKLGS